ncbi:MAG TPA: Rid family detoxifying hydrolase [Longimicrobiales bacterium]
MSDITSVTTTAAPLPAGHYSQGIRHAGLVYVAGQLPLDPATGEIAEGGIGPQAERTLRNVEAILIAGGARLDTLLSVTVYITDRTLWPAVNEVYARLLGDHRPARAVIPVAELKPGCLIEIQATAAIAG